MTQTLNFPARTVHTTLQLLRLVSLCKDIANIDMQLLCIYILCQVFAKLPYFINRTQGKVNWYSFLVFVLIAESHYGIGLRTASTTSIVVSYRNTATFHFVCILFPWPQNACHKVWFHFFASLSLSTQGNNLVLLFLRLMLSFLQKVEPHPKNSVSRQKFLILKFFLNFWERKTFLPVVCWVFGLFFLVFSCTGLRNEKSLDHG